MTEINKATADKKNRECWTQRFYKLGDFVDSFPSESILPRQFTSPTNAIK